MALTLGSNTDSLKAQRRLGEAADSLGKIYERLSSGLRINRAADDAAGLAISEKLNADSRVLGQAIRNLNDGISLVNIADATTQALSDTLARIVELAGQAANGSYTSTQRGALDQEAQALSKEYLRISRSAKFNGVSIFDGSMDAVRLQAGYGIDGLVQSSLGGAIGTGEAVGTGSYGASNTYAVESADLNGDGLIDLVYSGGGSTASAHVRLGQADGSFGAAVSYTMHSTFSNSGALALSDLNGDGVLDLVTGGANGTSGAFTLRLGNGDGSFGSATSFANGLNASGSIPVTSLVAVDINNDGKIDIVTAGINASPGGYVAVNLGNGDGTFSSASTYEQEGSGSYDLKIADLNGDGFLDIVTAGVQAGQGYVTTRMGNGTGTFGAATQRSTGLTSISSLSLADLNGDGNVDYAVGGIFGGAGSVEVRLGTSTGIFATTSSLYAAEAGATNDTLLGDMNGDGFLDLVTAGSTGGNIRFGQGNGTFGTQISFGTGLSVRAASLNDYNGDGVLDVAMTTTSSTLAIFTSRTIAGISALLPFSLTSSASARQALGQLEKAQDRLGLQQGIIGAFQSRLGFSVSNLESNKENYTIASSRIRDADIAAETADLLRTQILQDAASAVLAQVNQQPTLVLSLLES